MTDTPDYILKLSGLIVVALTENRVLADRISELESKTGIDPLSVEEMTARVEHHRQYILESLELRSPELAAHIALLFPDPPENQ